MPLPLSLSGWELILERALLPKTKATVPSITPKKSKPTMPQTKEAIARGSLCSGPVKFDWSFDGDMGGGGIGGGSEFTCEP